MKNSSKFYKVWEYLSVSCTVKVDLLSKKLLALISLCSLTHSIWPVSEPSLFFFFFNFGMEKSNFISEHFDRFDTSWLSLLVVEESSLSWPIPLLSHYNSPLCCLSKANAEVPTWAVILPLLYNTSSFMFKKMRWEKNGTDISNTLSFSGLLEYQ